MSYSRIVLVALLAAAPGRAQAQKVDKLGDLVSKSSFVFSGTVKQLNASTPTIPTGPSTVVVHVDSVLDAAPDMPRLAGNDVTVRLRATRAIKAGARRIFFTQPYSFGQTVGVEEIGSLPAADPEPVARNIKQARQKLADAALAARLGAAEAVVLARVVEIGPASQEKDRGSEHDPDWYAATLRPEQTLKGTPPARVLFARSRDVMWVATPKLKPGDQAIYVVQRNPSKDFPTKEPVIIHPLDVQEPAQLDRVKKLLAGGKP